MCGSDRLNEKYVHCSFAGIANCNLCVFVCILRVGLGLCKLPKQYEGFRERKIMSMCMIVE